MAIGAVDTRNRKFWRKIMKFIPTSQFTVEQIKKQAKKTQRIKGGKHTELLNSVAKQNGYLHWHHVTLCADHTEKLGSSSLSAECFYVMSKVRQGNAVLVLTGPETARTPFVLFGANNDAWLIELKAGFAHCLMLNGETFALNFEETSEKIEISGGLDIVKITEYALIIRDAETSVDKAYFYPSDMLEILEEQIMLAQNY